MKILIVEDNAIQLKLVNRIIEEIPKSQTLLAKDAFEAFAMLRAVGMVDIIILDYELPFVNGLSFFDKIQSDPTFENIPVILLTALDRLDSVPTKLTILKKPYKSQEIIHLILQKLGVES